MSYVHFQIITTRYPVVYNGSIRIYPAIIPDNRWYDCLKDSTRVRRITGYYLSVISMNVLFLLGVTITTESRENVASYEFIWICNDM